MEYKPMPSITTARNVKSHRYSSRAATLSTPAKETPKSKKSVGTKQQEAERSAAIKPPSRTKRALLGFCVMM